MTTRTRPLSYDASKCVLQYLPLDQRLNIRLRCPALRTADSVIPLKVETLQIAAYFLELNHIEYRIHSEGCNQIQIRNNRCNSIKVINFEAYRSLNERRSFLMDKLLGGRSAPMIFENLMLWNKTEQNFNFPTDMKMNVKNLRMYRVHKFLLEQLSTHIIGDPLSSFKVMHTEDLRNPAIKCALIQNAQKLHIPYKAIFESAHVLSVFPRKDIIISEILNGHANEIFVLIGFFLGQLTKPDYWTSLSMNVIGSRKADVFDFLRTPETRDAMVDDVENNLSNIPCVCRPVDQSKELNVYEIPGTRTDTILKLVVMPRGSARLNQ